MPSWSEQDPATFLANLLLPAACLYSAIRTFQVGKGLVGRGGSRASASPYCQDTSWGVGQPPQD